MEIVRGLMKIVRVIDSCRSCGSKNLKSILNLGEIYISDFVESDSQRGKAPLELVLCEDCSLLQLRHTTNPELLYRQYWYKSSINETIINDLEDIAEKAERMVSPDAGDIVLDIGANDGTLLRLFQRKGLRRVGFEPARNLLEEARKGTTEIINDFFNFEAFNEIFGEEKAKIITSIAMFYDLDDPNKFVEDIKKCLDQNGVWIIEMRYLPLMLGQTDISNVVHEHLEYYSLLSLTNLLSRHDLEIFDVELNQVNGGSFRTYIRHAGSPVKPFEEGKVKILENVEKGIGLQTPNPYILFGMRVKDIKKKLCDFVKSEHDKGKRIFAYGASTKGNTLLQCFELDHELIEAAAERDPRKFGKKTPGTGIKIISESEARERNPDYFLVLPFHFLKGFIEREKDYLKRGGKFIVPLPDFKVIGWEEVNAAQ